MERQQNNFSDEDLKAARSLMAECGVLDILGEDPYSISVIVKNGIVDDGNETREIKDLKGFLIERAKFLRSTKGSESRGPRGENDLDPDAHSCNWVNDNRSRAA